MQSDGQIVFHLVGGGIGGMFWCGVVYVYTHASFSKVTDADLGAVASLETGVMERVVIFPLCSGRAS